MTRIKLTVVAATIAVGSLMTMSVPSQAGPMHRGILHVRHGIHHVGHAVRAGAHNVHMGFHNAGKDLRRAGRQL